MKRLRFFNSQAPIHDFLIAGLAQYLSAEAGIQVDFLTEGSWQEREAMLESGEADVGWVCASAYLEMQQRSDLVAPLAAPVMADGRYQDSPIYFSDVLVRKDSSMRSFQDLRGMRWAYNEPGSISGYHLVRYSLAKRGLDGNFFGQVLESGAHQNSVSMLLKGTADASAIDSTVWEMLCRKDPGLTDSIRVLETLGPSPMPPFVAGAHISADTREMLAAGLVRLSDFPQWRVILQRAGMLRIARVTDHDYDPIRTMLRIAHPIQL